MTMQHHAYKNTVGKTVDFKLSLKSWQNFYDKMLSFNFERWVKQQKESTTRSWLGSYL